MSRYHLILAALGALALAGCETGGPAAGPSASLTEAPVQSSFRLPPDAPCAGEIGRYDRVVKADLSTGNVEQKVYDQIEGELRRAAEACSAGHGGEAHAIVAASKAKHGYRA